MKKTRLMREHVRRNIEIARLVVNGSPIEDLSKRFRLSFETIMTISRTVERSEHKIERGDLRTLGLSYKAHKFIKLETSLDNPTLADLKKWLSKIKREHGSLWKEIAAGFAYGSKRVIAEIEAIVRENEAAKYLPEKRKKSHA